PADEDPKTALGPCMLASLTSMQFESQQSRFGNPPRFSPLGNCSSSRLAHRATAANVAKARSSGNGLLRRVAAAHFVVAGRARKRIEMRGCGVGGKPKKHSLMAAARGAKRFPARS